ncbi:MAG: ParA family protein [Gammaproteobacteria bacterium]|nr:ParA family protein [Gammaproteobacteria bacterium]MCP4983786.1 ParA family protein [Gammaproteobacteria bacterium]
MRSIMVLNSKGGSGKSTIATSIASYYAAKGNKVMLVDFDPQASSLEWLAARPSGRGSITGIDGSSDQFRISRSADYVVYDTPAAVHGKELTAYLRRAQSIVIPVLPSPIDMRAATPFIQKVLDNGRVARKEARVALIANRCRENYNIYHQLDTYLRKVRKAPFISALRETQNYVRAAERGLGIFELAPYAVRKDLDQWEPIIRWLNSKRSLPLG